MSLLTRETAQRSARIGISSVNFVLSPWQVARRQDLHDRLLLLSSSRLRLPARFFVLAPCTRARLMMQYPNIDIQEGRRLRSVRRRLFQDDDDDIEGESGRNSGVEDNLANCFFEEARKNRENAKERWNFDFEKEEPLPGRYVWVKLDQDGNEIRNPLESNNRIENLQMVQKKEMQDDDVTMQEDSEDKDDDKMTNST